MQSKLSGVQDWASPAAQLPRDWPIARKLAVLDAVLNLDYHALRVGVKTAQADMIAGHMRIAFSVLRIALTFILGIHRTDFG
jgi:hypothetical protein